MANKRDILDELKTLEADSRPHSDGVMEIHYRMRFWKALAEIMEAIQPVVITAVKDHITRERARQQYGRNTTS